MKKSLNYDRLKKIIQEACEQSGRVKIPELGQMQSFKEALEKAPKPVLFLHIDKEINPTLPPLIIRGGEGGVKINNEHTISLFIGPEGGWTEEEAALALQTGASLVSLGPRVLRSETAAIAATAIVFNF